MTITTLCLALALANARADSPTLEERVSLLERQQFSHQELPPAMFAYGQIIPLDHLDVRARIEREFYSILADRATLILWQKRAALLLPYVTTRLAEEKMPDELKYVALLESGLQLNAYSYAGASGPWQFIKSTGHLYDLDQIGDAIDYRRDFIKSTNAAVSHFKDLYAIFKDWNLVLAAYNCGAGCVSSTMKSQDVSSFWDMVLPSETERYVPRAIAISLIMNNAEYYGVDINPVILQNKCVEQVKVSIKRDIQVTTLARMCAYVSWREIKLLNPWVKRNMLPRGEYTMLFRCGATTVLGENGLDLTLDKQLTDYYAKTQKKVIKTRKNTKR